LTSRAFGPIYDIVRYKEQYTESPWCDGKDLWIALRYNRAGRPEKACGVLKMSMIMGISYHSRSFLKTEFDETAESKNVVSNC
jgi:hypothetical protein